MAQRLADREDVALSVVRLTAVEVEFKIVFRDDLEINFPVELVFEGGEKLEEILIRLFVCKGFKGVESHQLTVRFARGVFMRGCFPIAAVCRQGYTFGMEGIHERKDSLERFNQLVGKLTLVRHGDTEYTNQYPDLTDEGKWKLVRTGRSLKEIIDEKTEDVLFVHSPSVRAKASMAFLLKGMGKIEGTSEADVATVARPVNALRSVGFIDREKAMELVAQHMGTDTPTLKHNREFDRIYALHDDFETSPHWEARSRVMRRGSRILQQAITMLVNNYTVPERDKTAHIVAVSHFEVLNDLAVKIHGLDMENDPLFARGERIAIAIKTDGDDMEKVLLAATFRGKEAHAWFSLKTGEISRIES